MKKIFSFHIWIVVVAIVAFIALVSLTIGAFDLPDTFFYMILGKYLMRGEWFPVNPYNVTIPMTLYSPIYSIFSYLLMDLPYPFGITLIPAIQLTIVFVNAWIISKVISKHISQEYGRIAAAIYVFLPFNLIHATAILSETMTTLLLSLFLLVLATSKNTIKAPLLVFVASLLTLTRNAMLPFFLISTLYWGLQIIRSPNRVKGNGLKVHIRQIPAVVGFILIASWVAFNYKHHGITALSNYTGRHLYNNAVAAGRLLPDPNEPIYKEFVSRTYSPVNVHWPVWDVQLFFANDYYAGKLTEVEVDRKFLAFALAAIKAHPVDYAINVMRLMWQTPTTPPYHTQILSKLGFKDPECDECAKPVCRIHWDGRFCDSYLDYPIVRLAWGTFIHFNRFLYPWVTGALFVIAGIGVVRGFFLRSWFLRSVAFLFLMQHTFQSAVQWLEGRFLVSIYPLYVICIIIGIRTIIEMIKKFRLRPS